VYLRHPDKPGLQLCVPQRAADLKRGLLHGILKDAGLSLEEFLSYL
jgi:predicted RNA binding protein YcfA (HicA-like mRNA interferase family)